MYRNRITEHLIIDSAELRRNPLNHRRHPDSQRHALRSLLGSVGIVDELLAYRDPEHGLTLVDGELRWSEGGSWPVAVLDLTPDEALTVLAMLDKIGADAEIDPEALIALLDSLPQQARQTAGAAWSDDELAAIIDGAVADEPESDEPVSVDETKPTRCQPGDVWRIGRHTVACVDSTDRATVEGLIAGRMVGMVWSDAPYGINIVTADGYVGGGEKYDIPFGGVKNRGAAKRRGTIGGDKPFGSARRVVGTVGADNIVRAGRYAPVAGDENADTARASALLLLDLYPDALHIWWGANHFSDVFPASPCWLVWDKENTGNFADAELAWCSDDSAVRIFKHMWNGMLRASEHEARIHPTQKPMALCAWAFEKYGSAADLVFDPFLGSGPSLKVAESLGRTVIGCELSPAYIDHLLEWGESHGLEVVRVTP